MPKTVAKKSKSKKPAARPKDWRDALRLHLAKVPTVDAVFVNTASDTVHVYSVVKEHRERYLKGLLRQGGRRRKSVSGDFVRVLSYVGSPRP